MVENFALTTKTNWIASVRTRHYGRSLMFSKCWRKVVLSKLFQWLDQCYLPSAAPVFSLSLVTWLCPFRLWLSGLILMIQSSFCLEPKFDRSQTLIILSRHAGSVLFWNRMEMENSCIFIWFCKFMCPTDFLRALKRSGCRILEDLVLRGKKPCDLGWKSEMSLNWLFPSYISNFNNISWRVLN